MSENLRAELERLKERQAQLHHGVDLLGVHIQALEKRIAVEEAAPGPVAAIPAEPASGVPSHVGMAAAASVAPLAVPPVLPVAERVGMEMESATQTAQEFSREGISESGNIQHSTFNAQRPRAAGVSPAAFNLQPATSTPATPPPLPPVAFKAAANAPAPAKPDSFEMRLGTYWLVRIGIVAMLTALVFFGTYAYQNYIGRIGPAGKVALLYLASGALLGFGAWFQRKAATESLRNYAQVLLAGGMAAVYFTTYAAHHFPNLQVIGSAGLDGALLLVWAAFMSWMADRKKSEAFAMFAVGLAYYTSVITRVGHFTLYSNLLLAAAVLFFLVRNRWAKLSFASLVATYAGYGFWRFYVNEAWQWAGPDANADLWAGVYFLAAYWVVFTAAVFLSRHKEFAGVNRASFITLNNAAFYAMFLLTMFQVRSGDFWKFNLITGAVLLAAAALAKVQLREEPLAANTYLTHGLLLVTVGIIAKFNDDQSTLALALGLESVVLWITGTMRRNIIMRTGACVTAALATIFTLDGIKAQDSGGVWLGAGVGALLVFNALWSHWKGQGISPRLLRPAPTYFSALALLLWAVTIWQNVATASRPAAYALLVIVLVATIPVGRLRELGLLGQGLLPVAAALFCFNVLLPDRTEPWWVFASLAGVAFGLVHWWQRQTVVTIPAPGRLVGQAVMALIAMGVVGIWIESLCETQEWLLTASVLVLAMTAYGTVTRNGMIALVGQGFGLVSVMTFFAHAGSDAVSGPVALSPVVASGVLAVSGRRWAEAYSTEVSYAGTVRELSVWYGRSAMALVIWWTLQYAGTHELVWSYTALGAVAFAVAGWRARSAESPAQQTVDAAEQGAPHPNPLPFRRGEGEPLLGAGVPGDFLAFSVVLNLCALASLVFHLWSGTAVYGPNFVAVLVWMVEQQIARRVPGRYPVPAAAHNLAMAGAGVALWWLVSRWVMQGFSGFYLTASWSVFAFGVFALGMGLRERIYRWLGLGVLGAALARVVIFDVWKLEPLYRILSFFALGVVLLVLGFIYNKYQERIRQWL